MQVRFVVPQVLAQVMMVRQSELLAQEVICWAQLVVAQRAQLTTVDVEFVPPLPVMPPVALAPPIFWVPPVLAAIVVLAPPAPPVPGLPPESLLLHPSAAQARREDIPRVLENGIGTSDCSVAEKSAAEPIRQT